MLKRIKKIFTETCIIFTILTLLLYCVGYLTVSSEISFKISGVFTLILLSFLLSVTKRILYVKSISVPVRIILHYLLVISVSYVIFALIGNIITTSLATLALLALVTLIYSIVTLVFVLRGEKKQAETEYQSMFKK